MKIQLKLSDLLQAEPNGTLHSDDPRWPLVLNVLTPSQPAGQVSSMAPVESSTKLIEYVRFDQLPKHLQESIKIALDQMRY